MAIFGYCCIPSVGVSRPGRPHTIDSTTTSITLLLAAVVAAAAAVSMSLRREPNLRICRLHNVTSEPLVKATRRQHRVEPHQRV